MNDNKTGTSTTIVRRQQDICGGLFLAACALSIIFNLVHFAHLVKSQPMWFTFLWTAEITLGFVFLYRLALNQATGIFAMCMMCIEFFFTFALPMIWNDLSDYTLLLWICIAFSFLSLYFWTMLFNNCDFRHKTINIVLIPVIYLSHIIVYKSHLSSALGLHPMLPIEVITSGAYRIVQMLILLYAGIGLWTMAHTRYFNGLDDIDSRANLSPFNTYTIIYIIVGIIFLIIF